MTTPAIQYCFVPTLSSPQLFSAELSASPKLDISRLLFDLKLCTSLVSRVAGCLEPSDIALRITDGLIEQFGCTFARIWLVEPDRSALRLVASSGLYTRLDGAFARVPMGAFKVGKIAEHCIPFLSNCLPDESWVKDRQWAIDNQIKGFAGLPLMLGNQSLGVLAIFSRKAMAPEFLEVLQILSLAVANALASALEHHSRITALPNGKISLSEQLAQVLGGQKLSLLGTERSLTPSVSQLLVQTAKQLAELPCHYCRLVYESEYVALEGMLAVGTFEREGLNEKWNRMSTKAQQLKGDFWVQTEATQKVAQVRLQLPLMTETQSDAEAAADSPLSEREQEVIELLVQGLRDREIAERLYISERTVKFHVKNMLKKLDVKTRIQGVFKATNQGWLG
ncbi:MAG: LuxR C-terminal-related transcriptional regulator [Cyanobacteria bacterium J06627_28]